MFVAAIEYCRFCSLIRYIAPTECSQVEPDWVFIAPIVHYWFWTCLQGVSNTMLDQISFFQSDGFNHNYVEYIAESPLRYWLEQHLAWSARTPNKPYPLRSFLTGCLTQKPDAQKAPAKGDNRRFEVRDLGRCGPHFFTCTRQPRLLSQSDNI